MLVRVPDYYSKFVCSGTDCPDTCCRGWLIEIDSDSYERFMRLEGSIGEEIRRNIVIRDGIPYIATNEDGHCSFLNKDRLCDLYIKLGPGSQCALCDNFPRIGEEYGSLRELGLSAACPEAAGMILNHTGKISYEEWEIEEDYQTDTASLASFDIMLRLREVAILIAENSAIGVNKRLALLLVFASQIQNGMDSNDADELENIIIRFTDNTYMDRLLTNIEKDLKVSDSAEIMEEIYHSMEKLCINKDWAECINEAYGMEAGKSDFTELNYENMMVYFLLRYFLKAHADGDVYSKTVFIFYSLLLLNDMSAKLKRSREYLFYMFSREIEHCEENMELLFDMFYGNDWNNPQKLIKSIYFY